MELDDPEEVRQILDTDPDWALYARADLDPAYAAHARWFAGQGDVPSVALLYRAFGDPVLLTVGPAGNLREILALILNFPHFVFVVRPDVFSLLESSFRIARVKSMRRMMLRRTDALSGVADGARRLEKSDLPALRGLYDDGRASGESPDFFLESMVMKGVYFGAWEAGDLVAVAGTHVLSLVEGVAGIGNVYTRRDRRGRGLAGLVTGAVARELSRLGVVRIGLNVDRLNASAIRVYERLGFEESCEYREGIAELHSG